MEMLLELALMTRLADFTTFAPTENLSNTATMVFVAHTGNRLYAGISNYWVNL
jgi:hypothetical protein